MRLLITGGTGFIGGALCRTLLQHGHELLILSRQADRQPPAPKVTWLSLRDSAWQQTAEGCDGVINLAGEPLVARRWSPAQKELIRQSRLQTTRQLVETIARWSRKPTVFVSASAIGYYGPCDDEELRETDDPGKGFLADLCRAWEAEAQRAGPLGPRVVILRIGVVLAPSGGALAKMLPPFRWFMGGPLGNGRQWVSWIHRDDILGLIEWVLTRSNVSGPVNATAPQPVRMREFCHALGAVLHRPSWVPAPAIILRLLLGEMADVLLTGQCVVPGAALRAGYTFRFPALLPALEACVG